MSKWTGIQWCDSTVNPVMGCAGCELWSDALKICYAGKLHKRRPNNKGFALQFLNPTLFPGRMVEAAKWRDLTGTSRPDKPWLDGLPRHIFTSDMGDALSEHGAVDAERKPIAGGAVPFWYLKQEIIDVALSPNGSRHRWLWLTKRPHRLAQFCRWLKKEHGLDLPANIWVGTSVTSRKTLGRITQLRKVGGTQTLRFLSVEPLWEKVSLAGRLDGIGWVIVGGESGGRKVASKFDCDWVRHLRDECATERVAFFIKQLGSNVIDGGKPLTLKDGHGGDWSEWAADLRVRQMPNDRRAQ